jgi:hypothetical protein
MLTEDIDPTTLSLLGLHGGWFDLEGTDMPDILTSAFLALRARFFDETGTPTPFRLRNKRNTQDDPFDEFLATDVLSSLEGMTCAKASGPLITPDMVLYRPERCEGAALHDLVKDLDLIVGVEVKKLERTVQGGVARASGLDYNTTPPCGRIRVYDAASNAVALVTETATSPPRPPSPSGEGGVEISKHIDIPRDLRVRFPLSKRRGG